MNRKTKMVARNIVIRLTFVISLVLSYFGVLYFFEDRVEVKESGSVVASFDGQDIYQSELDRKFNVLDANKQKIPFVNLTESQQKSLIREAVAQRLVVEQAKKQRLHEHVAINDRFEQILKDAHLNLVRNQISEEFLVAKYEEIKDKLGNKNQYTASHILVKTESEAKKISKKLKGNSKNFAKLAKANSIDKNTVDNGGKLGFMLEGTINPVFETELKKLSKGSISKPFQTASGWHIVYLEDVKMSKVESYQQMRPKLIDKFAPQLVKQYVNQLLEGTEISYKL